MAAQKLTPPYRRKLEDKLAEFRRVSSDLRVMLHKLEMPAFMDLLAGGLGLSAGEIELLTYDEHEDAEQPRPCKERRRTS